MSRIGNKVITLPAGVEITNNDNVVTVKGPKANSLVSLTKTLKSKLKATKLHFTVQTTQKKTKQSTALHVQT